MPSPSSDHLIIFTRYPQAGTTKTRLIPALGEKGAADLQRRMTERIALEARKQAFMRPVETRICFEGGDRGKMASWLGPDFSYRPQCDGDLGNRMTHAFRDAFETGARKAVIVGSDIPGLSAAILQRAFSALNDNDLVLGPARDGGYYLIGLRHRIFKHAIPDLFAEIHWGTDTVLGDTLVSAEKLDLKVDLTDRLDDIDRPEDLATWRRHASHHAESVSVIIPALNEARGITSTLRSVVAGGGSEIILVDGGSTDGTPDLAAAQGARVLHTSPSKARQMNLGANAATGSILLFLHADTLLPESFEATARKILERPDVSAGAFSLKIDSAKPGVRMVESVANLRARILGMPYGDQALFMRSDLFFKVGGFSDIPIMEDFALIRLLGKHGRIAVSKKAVLTSGRRWENIGILRAIFINQAIILAYHLGTPARKLARWYRRRPYNP